MASFIILSGVQPWDGRYDFETADLTTREWGWIKKYSSYMPLTIEDGFQGGDPELFAVFAMIAVRRAGRIDIADIPGFMDRLLDADLGSIRVETDDEQEEDASPPPVNNGANEPTSGPSSPTSSASPEPLRNGSGIPVSATSESHPAQWAS